MYFIWHLAWAWKSRSWFSSHSSICSHLIIAGKFICYIHIILRVLVVGPNFRTTPPKHVHKMRWGWRFFVTVARTYGLGGYLKTISFEYQKEYHISVMLVLLCLVFFFYHKHLNGCKGWTLCVCMRGMISQITFGWCWILRCVLCKPTKKIYWKIRSPFKVGFICDTTNAITTIAAAHCTTHMKFYM